MSDNKLLKENTVRRFMKLANVGRLSDNFINEKFKEPLIEQEEPMEDEEELDMGEEEPMEDEEELEMEEEPMEDEEELDMGEEEPGAADISLTEEEAELLIDLGERLREALGSGGEEEDLEMEDEPMEDEEDLEMEEEPEDLEMDEPALDDEEEVGYRDSGMTMEAKEKVVQEVLKRVTKRLVSERIKK